MSIRPIDLSVLVPKTAEVSKVEHTESRRPEVEGQQFAETMMKQSEHSGQHVIQSNKTEQESVNKDGSNKNQYERKNKKKKKNDQEKTKSNTTSMFDVSV